MPVFGPGTLSIGATGTEIDVECLINSCRITSSKDESDSTTKLCGTVKPGKITYTFSLTGNIDVDSESSTGLFALSQASPGSQQPFEFVPSTPGVTSAAGSLIIDPLDFGADAFGDDMTSDFEFSIVGPVTYTYGAEVPPESDQPLVIVGRQAGATTTPPPEPAKTKTKAA